MTTESKKEEKSIDASYETDKVYLALYWEGRDSLFPETTLSVLYAQTKEEGLLTRSFGSMGKSVTLNRFLSYLLNKPVVIGFDKNNNKVIGYGYLSEVETGASGKKASGGYVFFKEYWGSEKIRDLAHLTMMHWFCGLNVDVLYGTMMKTNRLALKFATEMGFRVVGYLPKFFICEDEMQDGIMVVVEKETYLASKSGA